MSKAVWHPCWRVVINEALGEVKAASIFEVLGQCLQDSLQRTVAHPPLEAPVADLVWGVSLRQVMPGSACA